MLSVGLSLRLCRPGVLPVGLHRLRDVRYVHNNGKQTTAEHESSHTHSHLHPTSPEPHSHSHSSSHSHSHSHSHSITGELLSTGKVRDPAVKITLIGFVVNVGMAISKGVGGVMFNSQSLVADAIHAASDLVSDVMTLATVSIARRPPSAMFPNGYGRIEAVGALGVSSMLLFAGASMGWGSFVEITSSLGIDLATVFGLGGEAAHSHSHKLPAEWSAAYIALASIAIKEALYQATKRVADQQNSPVLLANAWHHRVDCLVSAVAVTSISAGQLLQAAWVDPLGGLLVSGLIVRAGWQPAKDSVLELCGNIKPAVESPKFAELQSVVKDELSKIAPNYKLVRCTLEPYGSTFVSSVQLKNVDGNVEAVAAQLKKRLLEIDHMRQVYVRV